MSDALRVEKEGVVTCLTLNRPEKANALDGTLVEALLANAQQCYADGTRLLVLKGEGAHFCAGFDFTNYTELSEGDLVLRFLRIETLLQTLYYAPFETIAFAQGRNFGAGVDLIVACSTRVASPGSTFRMPGLCFGLTLGIRRLCHRLGEESARDVLMVTRTLTAEEAVQVGLLKGVANTSEWKKITEGAQQRATFLSAEAGANLRSATSLDTRLADMAAVAISASSPGIKDRIRAFRQAR